MPRRAETRKRRTSGAVASMDMDRGDAGRGEAPARRRPPIRNPPSFRSAALELSASCVRAGFPPPGRRGAYNAELAAAKGRSPEGGAPRGPRDGRENFLKKVLDTAERAR